MSDYIATARSNYFRVRDEAKFMEWADELGLQTRAGEGRRSGMFCLLDVEGNGFYHFSDRSVPMELAGHLAAGEVAVFMEVGSEKLKYVNGCATAVHSSGASISMSLDEIYGRARKAWPGAVVTEAEY